MQHIIEVKLEWGDIMTSYGIKALFTLVLMDTSINIVKQKLQQHPLLPQRTNMSIQQIVTLLEFCYHGLPISPLIADLFMVEFKVKAFSSAPHPPYLWLRYVDDSFVIQEVKHSQ